jgi:hypothetical protein
MPKGPQQFTGKQDAAAMLHSIELGFALMAVCSLLAHIL